MDAETTAIFQFLQDQRDKTTPIQNGGFFFQPFPFVLELLGMPEVFKLKYEESLVAGGLSWKTFQKWIALRSSPIQTRPTQLLKLSRMMASIPGTIESFKEVSTKETLWRPYPDWLRLVRDCFIHEECSTYWEGNLEAEWQLVCQTLPAASSIPDRLNALANCALLDDLGAPGSRQRLINLLASGAPAKEIVEGTEFINGRLADIFSLLLRFAAWFVVDASIQYWDQAVREGKENMILLEPLLPRCQADGGWSDPVWACLESFAEVCKCPPKASLSSSLGRIWADAEFTRTGACDIEVKQRTLRDWLAGNMGRPKRQSVQSLALAIATKTAQLEGRNAESVTQEEVFNRDFRFHFAETCRFTLREMQVRRFTVEMIESVFSSYSLEYRKARALLGRPLG